LKAGLILGLNQINLKKQEILPKMEWQQNNPGIINKDYLFGDNFLLSRSMG
jgi:hypothetical protein